MRSLIDTKFITIVILVILSIMAIITGNVIYAYFISSMILLLIADIYCLKAARWSTDKIEIARNKAVIIYIIVIAIITLLLLI